MSFHPCVHTTRRWLDVEMKLLKRCVHVYMLVCMWEVGEGGGCNKRKERPSPSSVQSIRSYTHKEVILKSTLGQLHAV